MDNISISYTGDLRLEVDTLRSLCSIIDSDRSREITSILDRGDFNAYVNLDIDAEKYEDLSSFADDYLITSLLSKSPNLNLGVDRKKAALDSFLQSEASCRETNARFPLFRDSHHPVWVYEMRRIVQQVLGPLSTRAIESVAMGFSHGPGATTSVRGVGSTQADKYARELHLTANLVPFYRSITGETWASAQQPSIVRGSKFTTVPKSAKTDRGICVEPGLNIYVQKGIGAYIRNRLKRFGVDINTQARNQEFARLAYSCDFSTIDLSGASDSIAWNLVQYMVGPSWSHLLSMARSPSTLVDGDWVELEKVSSMGNGFTFELETLLFWALTQVFYSPEEVTVYGDDIIIPRRNAIVFIDALNYLGFSVNGAKSFLAGNFFESCGSDYFKGLDVRPFYLKGSKQGIPYQVQIANKLRLYSAMRGRGFGCDARFRPLWVSLFKSAPRQWRNLIVPPVLGDTGFIGSAREATFLHPKDETLWYEKRAVVKHAYLAPVQKWTLNVGMLLTALRLIRGAYPDSFPDSGPDATRGKLPRRGYLGRLVTREVAVSHSDFSGLEWTG